MATRKQLLEYVKNTGGNATIGNFVEDWEPIGMLAWDELSRAGLTNLNKDGHIQLTEAGYTALGIKCTSCDED